MGNSTRAAAGPFAAPKRPGQPKSLAGEIAAAASQDQGAQGISSTRRRMMQLGVHVCLNQQPQFPINAGGGEDCM